VFAEYEKEGCDLLLQCFVEKFDEFQFEAHVNQELLWTDKNKN
jgi:hypothetical protein